MSRPDHLLDGSASAMAAAVRAREVSVAWLVEASLARIAATEPAVHAFAQIAADRARQRAEALDMELLERKAAAALLPLVGVPFAVSNAIEVAGLPTRAGTALEHERVPARRDAVAVARLEEAGAVVIGATNLDAFGAGSTTETSCEGASRNPHDFARTPGGASGGSAAAVASGQLPVALGVDTTGGVRVPASLSGLFALKPTYGRVPRAGVYATAPSLDHVGAFARRAADLAAVHDALQGHDARDATCAARAAEPTVAGLWNRVEGLRIAVLVDAFDHGVAPEARAAVSRVAEALQVRHTAVLAATARANAAATIVALAEAAALHLDKLRQHAGAYPAPWRDGLLAAALMPSAWLQQAQRLRRWYALRAAELLREFDVLVAPATPCTAPRLGATTLALGDREFPIDAALTAFTLPFSFTGLPAAVVPVWECHPTLPIGVQLIGAPWREDILLRVARHLQGSGIARAPVATVNEHTFRAATAGTVEA